MNYDEYDYYIDTRPRVSTLDERGYSNVLGFRTNITQRTILIPIYESAKRREIKNASYLCKKSKIARRAGQSLLLEFSDNLECKLRGVKQSKSMTMFKDIMKMNVDELLVEYGNLK